MRPTAPAGRWSQLTEVPRLCGGVCCDAIGNLLGFCFSGSVLLAKWGTKVHACNACKA